MSDESKEQREQKYKKHHELLTATYGAFADLQKELQAQAPTQNKYQKHTPQIYITPSRINPFDPRDSRIHPDIALEDLVKLQLQELKWRQEDCKTWKIPLSDRLPSLEHLPENHKYRVAYNIAKVRMVASKDPPKMLELLASLIVFGGIVLLLWLFSKL